MNTPKPAVFIDLGWVIGRLNGATGDNSLVMMYPSDFCEGPGNDPAQCIRIYGDEALKRLRDALITAYPLEPEQP